MPVSNDVRTAPLTLPASGFVVDFTQATSERGESSYGHDLFYTYTPTEDVAFAIWVENGGDPNYYRFYAPIFLGAPVDETTYFNYDTVYVSDTEYWSALSEWNGGAANGKEGGYVTEMKAGNSYTIVLTWFNLSTNPPSGPKTVHWTTVPASQPTHVASTTGDATFLALGDGGEGSNNGLQWSLAMITKVGGQISMGTPVPFGIGATPLAGEFVSGYPHVARATDTTAAFVSLYFLGDHPQTTDDRWEVWAHKVDISSGTPVISAAQMLWTANDSVPGTRQLSTTIHPIAAWGDYVLIPARANQGGSPTGSQSWLYCYRMETDGTFTLTDSWTTGVLTDGTGYRYYNCYPTGVDGEIAVLWNDSGFGAFYSTKVTISPTGSLTVGSDIPIPFPYAAGTGYYSADPFLIPGTRKVVNQGVQFTHPDGEYDALVVQMTDIDTGQSGSVARLYLGEASPRGGDITSAGRTPTPGVYGLLVGPDRRYSDSVGYTAVVKPFTISGNDFSFVGTDRILLNEEYDTMGFVQGNSDFGRMYHYDGGLFAAFQEYVGSPFNRIVAGSVDQSTGAGVTTLYGRANTGPWYYHFETMSVSAPPPPPTMTGLLDTTRKVFWRP